MKRALLIVLDSVGIGHAPDAADFGDEGANTVGHIRETLEGFSLPNLDRCGLQHAEALAAGFPPPKSPTQMAWGCLREQSAGKDTTTGHWGNRRSTIDQGIRDLRCFPSQSGRGARKSQWLHFYGELRSIRDGDSRRIGGTTRRDWQSNLVHQFRFRSSNSGARRCCAPGSSLQNLPSLPKNR